MSASASPRKRGQSGLTLVELLVAIAVGTIVLLPMFGLVSVIIKRQQPTIKSANASKQLRLFRSTLATDWAAAKVIKTGVNQTVLPHVATVECNRGSYSSYPSSTPWPVVGPLISIQTFDTRYPSKKIVYNKVPNPTLGGYDIVRRECSHRTEVVDGLTKWTLGGLEEHSLEPPAAVIILKGVTDLQLGVVGLTDTANCNPISEFPKAPTLQEPTLPPYEMCDMNITVTGLDGQKSTIRLYQHAGRDS
jgi:prepilin-type N-terminal cleavage/methylation domain-containing protein